ncbi:MAG: phytanoyl-CoA dioxygenase family protein [bacterium]|nr:phytanoyl-CoA dioxygenase family protein [bacterium]
MKSVAADTFEPEIVAKELLEGSGAVCLPGLFNEAQVNEAREIILAETADHNFTGSHFNKDDEDAKLQRRVWNLIGRGQVFVDMVQHPLVMASMRAFLGTEFILGSICASRTMPGFGGQQPHIDYPYWDLYRDKTFPMRINASFPLNAQATIVIDPFTEERGATALLPGSQNHLRYPRKTDDFFGKCERLTGEPGDVILFYGAAWHCAMPNRSEHGRIGILIEYLPKFVKPIEDMLSGLDQDFVDNADPMMRQLLGFSYPWPSAPPNPPPE